MIDNKLIYGLNDVKIHVHPRSINRAQQNPE